MTRNTILALTVLFVAHTAALADGADALQGIWIAAPEPSVWSRITVTGDRVAIDMAAGRQPVHGFLQVDASKSPATLDLTLEHKGRSLGIYKVDGDTLTLCLSERYDTPDRPSSFSAGEKQILLVRTRKPAVVEVPADAEDPGPTPTPAGAPIELPKPSGPLGVGRATYHMIDASRDDPNLDPPQHYRELLVHLFYPVDRGAAGAPAAYFPALSLVNSTLGEAAMKDDLEDAYPSVFSARSHAVTGAPAASPPRRYPIVLFLPGQGASATQYTALIEELVSHGYVVAGIEHTFYASAVVFPGSRVVRLAADRWEKGMSGSYAETVEFSEKINDMLAGDAVFVLDQLGRIDSGAVKSAVEHRLDLEKVAILGHSSGARGAALAYQRDPRMRGCLSLDGFSPAMDAYGNFGGWSAPRPFMLLRPAFSEPSKQVLQQAKMTERGFLDWMERSSTVRKAFFGRVQPESWEVTFDVPGAAHSAFTDLPLLSSDRDPAKVAYRERAMQIIRAYARAFLESVLGGTETGLLARGGARFPEVSLQRFRPVAP